MAPPGPISPRRAVTATGSCAATTASGASRSASARETSQAEPLPKRLTRNPAGVPDDRLVLRAPAAETPAAIGAADERVEVAPEASEVGLVVGVAVQARVHALRGRLVAV